MVHSIELNGCAPYPLQSYLKALGVFRVLSQQADDSTRAYWEDDHFFLQSPLDNQAIEDFFLHTYRPQPIVTPWNGGSGFHPKDNQTALLTISNSSAERWTEYGEVIRACQTLMERLGMDTKITEKTHKEIFLQAARGSLPDSVLPWLDAVVLLASDGIKMPPLLGTGGNDGRLEFGNNFMQRALDVIDGQTGQTVKYANALLDNALWGTVIPGLSNGPPGQFNPGTIGGPNATAGFEADFFVNPWDYLLMMEGVLVFSAAASRRYSSKGAYSQLSYPFTVDAMAAGHASIGPNDQASQRRYEMWMPLWGNPATYLEIQHIFGEGRAQINTGTAQNATDFARACATLGVDRGIHAFQRFGFVKRSGRMFLATPLARMPVQRNAQAELVADMGNWQRRFSMGEDGPREAQSILLAMQNATLSVCKEQNTPGTVQELIRALGRAEMYLRRSPKAREHVKTPLVLSNPEWHTLAADESDPNDWAFRIAAALASICHPAIGPLRFNLSPLRPKKGAIPCDDKRGNLKWEDTPAVVDMGGGLTRFLVDVLIRREHDYRKTSKTSYILQADDSVENAGHPKQRAIADKPFSGSISVDLHDITRFIEDNSQDRRIMELLWGLSVVNHARSFILPTKNSKDSYSARAPLGYQLLKPLFVPDQTLKELWPGLFGDDWHLPIPARISGLLRARDFDSAVAIATHRLRSSGFPIKWELPLLLTGDPERIIAALLIPIQRNSVRQLGRCLGLSEVPSHTLKGGAQ